MTGQRRSRPGLAASLALLFAAALPGARLQAQAGEGGPAAPVWSAPRSFSVFAEYSPDSSHILLGDTGQREFVTVGATFSRRLSLHRSWEFSWTPEIRPIMAESDPVMIGHDYDLCIPMTPAGVGQPCTPEAGYYHYPHEVPAANTGLRVQDTTFSFAGQTYYQDYAFFYGRRWTYVAGLSPLAFRASFLPRRRLQPMLSLTGGFAVSPRDIPMFDTSAFNFTFSFGGGFRFWRDRTHATEIEYRFQHLSNATIGYNDPGIDSQFVHLSYTWGKGGR